jgi:hypothetical protein
MCTGWWWRFFQAADQRVTSWRWGYCFFIFGTGRRASSTIGIRTEFLKLMRSASWALAVILPGVQFHSGGGVVGSMEAVKLDARYYHGSVGGQVEEFQGLRGW